MSEKLKLTAKGKLFNDSLRACLNWLQIGGELKIESDVYRLVMTDDGGLGFAVKVTEGDKEPYDAIYWIDDPVTWFKLVKHAQGMTEKDLITMQTNNAFNEINQWRR